MDATRTTPLRERMRQELQLAGLSERTQEAYDGRASPFPHTQGCASALPVVARCARHRRQRRGRNQRLRNTPQRAISGL